MAKKIGLGKNVTNLGLKELVGDLNIDVNAKGNENLLQLKKLSIKYIRPGKYQPRKSMGEDQLEELANSIRSQGLLQPIIVRQRGNNDYEIIAGERRWRAAQLAGLTDIPIIVKKLNDKQALAVSLIENIQREDLNIVDEAEALQRLSKEFSLTHKEVADVVGKSRTAITNILRLLNLQDEVKEFLASGDLEMGHARALLTLPSAKQIDVANTVIKRGLSVRETEKLANNLQIGHSGGDPISSALRKIDADILKLQNKIGEKISAKVKIKQVTKQKGHLIIYYNSRDELDGILKRF